MKNQKRIFRVIALVLMMNLVFSNLSAGLAKTSNGQNSLFLQNKESFNNTEIRKEFRGKDGKTFISIYGNDGRLKRIISPGQAVLNYDKNGKATSVVLKDGKVIKSKDPKFATTTSSMFYYSCPAIPIILAVIEEIITGIGATVLAVNLVDKTIYATINRFPSDPSKMDEMLGKQHSSIPDEPGKPGRNKKIWYLELGYEIVQEAHPYDAGAPTWHRSIHWHIITPDGRHLRYLVGQIIPDWVFNFLN